jgi:hypothetical protein
MYKRAVLGAAGLLFMTLHCVPAQAAVGLSSCKVGDRVQDDAGGKGTVTYVNADGSCGFRYDNSGLVNTYPPSALRAVGAPVVPPAGPGSVTPGRYECYAGENYTFTDIIIRSPTAYSDNKGNGGSYTFDKASQRITFKSGTFKGQYSKYMMAGRIGLSSSKDTFFSMTCDLKR